MQILKPHFKNYRKEIILAIITILISAFATLWQPRLLENIQKAILADNQSVVLRDGIGLELNISCTRFISNYCWYF